MLILLSPAKKLDYDTAAVTARYSEPEMLRDAQYLINKLKKFSTRKIGKMMQISPALADLNCQRYRNFHAPFTPENAKQAALVFKGDIYLGLDAESFDDTDFTFAQKHLRILSGLYGLLKPLDLIQPYRLEMGSNFAVTAKLKNLYLFWGDKITQAVNRDLQAQGDKGLINLASNEYSKSVKAKEISGQFITPSFQDLKNGRYKPVFLWVKQARGMMARYIVKNRLTNVEDAKGFNMNGYCYNEEMSHDTQWVFIRDKQP
jgi:cytoplasmic iron level regulating protein YaaA (DUF328/UPF0246 family)